MPRAYLFPQLTVNEYPANLGSADAEYLVTAGDSLDYVVKTCRRHQAMPISELLSHNIADACGVPTPQFTLVQLMNGDVGFGSQWDDSAIKDQAIRNSIVTAIPGSPVLAAQFSGIYVLDLFLHNDDRHLGNYLFVSTNQGVGVKAYDFSRSLFFHGWPPPQLPLDPHSNTVQCYRSLRVGYPFDPAVGKEAIRRLRGIDSPRVARWLEEAPTEWMSDSSRREFVSWWQSEALTRLDTISKGLGDGSLL